MKCRTVLFHLVCSVFLAGFSWQTIAALETTPLDYVGPTATNLPRIPELGSPEPDSPEPDSSEPGSSEPGSSELGTAIVAPVPSGAEPAERVPETRQVKLSVGAVTLELTSLADPEQRYALYLPSNYRTDRTWPVLVVMDPRGRAVTALEHFRPGAEELGYVVVSSYGTLSDSSDAFLRNQAATDAILKDLPRLVSTDPAQLYLAGFSGTSRVAWIFGLALKGNVAGIIGCGGGLPEVGPGLQETIPFSYFGLAGTTDFNYQEMRRLDRDLDRLGAGHRFAEFEGGHQWMPSEVATGALAWMRLRAMATGLREVDKAWLQQHYEDSLATAIAVRDKGNERLAIGHFRDLESDFSPWLDVSEARDLADVLSRSETLRKVEELDEKLARQEEVFQARFEHWFEKWRNSELVSAPGRALAELQVKALRRQTQDSDPQIAQSAQRRLTSAFVQLHASLALRFQVLGRHEREVAVLTIANAIYPQNRGAQFKLAKAYTRWGRYEPAFEVLEKAVGSGPTDLRSLEEDPDLAPLRGKQSWNRILQSAQQAAPPEPAFQQSAP